MARLSRNLEKGNTLLAINIKISAALGKAALRFDAQEQRKRIMMLAIALLALAMLWQNFIWLPHQNKVQMLLRVQIALRKSLPELQSKVAKSSHKKRKIDPSLLRKQQIQALTIKHQELVKRLGREAGALIQPSEMLTALKRLLAERPKVTLIRLDASKIQPIQLGSAEAAELVSKGSTESAVIFRHDIELEVEASYLDTLALFEEIEGYPWVFYWDEARYEAMTYPNTRTTIRLFTLSMGKGLIGG